MILLNGSTVIPRHRYANLWRLVATWATLATLWSALALALALALHLWILSGLAGVGTGSAAVGAVSSWRAYRALRRQLP
jgi:hypothetical protein